MPDHVVRDAGVAARPERLPGVWSGGPQSRNSVAAELGANILFNVNGAPEYVGFMLVEEDNTFVIARIVTTIPFKQSFEDVLGDAEIMEGAWQMLPGA